MATENPSPRPADAERVEHFAAHYRAHLDAILAYARRRTESPEAAEEVVAETFLVLWRRLDDLPAEPLPWLYGVARHVLANRRRGARRHEALLHTLAHDRSLHGALGGAAPTETEPQLAAALEALAPAAREALLLVAWEGLTTAAGAAAMGISRATFNRHLARGRRAIRDLIEREEQR